jgi:ubiquinone/menaquinone biosynthesis C-methylase UbiE
MNRLLQRADVKTLSRDQWRDKLVASVEDRVLDGVRYPGFPDESIQRQFVGSSNADAIGEGFSFYDHVHGQMGGRKYKASRGQRYLDFGAGWGRIGRFFLRDFERGDMAGVDIDDKMVAFCQEAEVPGLFMGIANGEALPFADGSFRLITAYSVFTHLPRNLFEAWMAELLRVLAPGGLLAFTVEPERFLDFIAAIDETQSDSDWHRSLASYKVELPRMRAEVAKTGIAYMATGGGDMRTPDVYGEAVVSRAYLEKLVKPRGRLVDYVDDASRFWQAVAVVQRTRHA